VESEAAAVLSEHKALSQLLIKSTPAPPALRRAVCNFIKSVTRLKRAGGCSGAAACDAAKNDKIATLAKMAQSNQIARERLTKTQLRLRAEFKQDVTKIKKQKKDKGRQHHCHRVPPTRDRWPLAHGSRRGYLQNKSRCRR
jgi:hypothetical protein